MPQPDQTITGPDGQLRKWQPETRNLEAFNYLGPASGFSSVEEAAQADADSGQGSWVPAAYGGGMPWWMKAFVATGLGSMAVTGLGALAAPGAFGGAGGAGAAGGTGAAGAGGAGAAGGAAAAAPSLGVPIGAGTSATALSTGAGIAPVGLGAAPAAATGGGSVLGGLLGHGTNASKVFNAGQILSNYASGAAQGRQAEANLNLNSDALRQRQAESERQDALDRAKLEMDQRKTGQNLETQARQQAAIGLYQKNGPVTITPPANIASHMGTIGNVPDFSSIGQQAYDAAMKRLLSGSDKTFTTPPTVRTPTLTPQPNESWLDKLARWGGTGAGIAGSLGGYRPPTTGGR